MGKRNREKGIYFMVSEQEYQMIEERMRVTGIRSIRAYLLKMAADGYVLTVDLSDVKEMVSLLRNSTNNLNQIAKRVNETNHVYREDIRDLQEKYELIWGSVKEILKGLAKL